MRATVLASALAATFAHAQIRTDGTLGGAAQTLQGPNYMLPQSLGRLAGSNLFHSFSVFNIQSGESATFTTTTAGIANVITRVTGGSTSLINGPLALQAASGAPNFFFINPAGVVFGAGASIDVPGSFHASTADYLVFGDGKFYVDPKAVSTFSSAAPEAFGFLGTHRAAVAVTQGATLSMRPLQALNLVGGDIDIEGGAVSATGGEIRILALGQNALEVPLTGPLPSGDGHLLILNGGFVRSSSTTGSDGGTIRLSGGSVVIDGHGVATGVFSNADAGQSNGGEIEVSASGTLGIMNGGAIASRTTSAGNSGAVRVRAANILIDNPVIYPTDPDDEEFVPPNVVTGIFNNAELGRGNAGVIDVAATGNISIFNGGQIASRAFSIGNAGQVKVTANTIEIDARDTGLTTGILSDAASGIGSAGTVEVTAAESLTMSNGGQISSDTYSVGDAGSVKVSARNITIDGANSDSFTGIFSDANEGSRGNAGSVEVTAGTLSIFDGGQISSSTYSTGNAGTVRVSAENITMDGHGNEFTSISSDANEGSSGNAGDVEVRVTGNLTILNSAFISSDTYASGKAGTVKVTAANITIRGEAVEDTFTGISSEAVEGTGDAGSILVDAGNLTVVHGGRISSDTYTSGNAGVVQVRAGSMTLDGTGSDSVTAVSSDANEGSTGNARSVVVLVSGHLSITNGSYISSDTYASGHAGSVKVNAGSITIDQQNTGYFAGISSTANAGSSGAAGDVEVVATDSLSLLNGGAITSYTEASGDAGAVRVTAGTLFMTGGSSYISSSTFSSGNAGSVRVLAREILLDGKGSNAGIYSTAHGSGGNGGSVEVTATEKLSLVNGGQILTDTYSSGNAGSVKVNAGSIVIDRAGGQFTGISSDANANTTGRAGDVQVTAGSLEIISGGQISSSAYSSGNAGSVEVAADRIEIDARGFTTFTTGILSTATLNSSGNAGSVRVTASGNLAIVNGGQISSSTSSSGHAGSVVVLADSVDIDSRGSSGNTGVFSRAFRASSGNAGSVDVTATDTLSLRNGGSISSSTASTGDAGSVTVSANMLMVDGRYDASRPSSINATAEVGSSGQTGSVDVRALDTIALSNGGELAITNFARAARPEGVVPTLLTVSAPHISLSSGGQITAAAYENVAASDIRVNFGSSLSVSNSVITTTARDGNGGSIVIDGEGVLALHNGQITTSVSGLSGNGGDINVKAKALVMETGFIQANTAASDARGGNVAIDVQMLVPSGNTLFLGGESPLAFQSDVFGLNVIQAAAPTGVSGSIEITTPALDISGGLSGLNVKVIDTGGLGRSLCQSTGGSSLSQTGRGGLAPSSRDLLRVESPVRSPAVASAHPDIRLSSLKCRI